MYNNSHVYTDLIKCTVQGIFQIFRIRLNNKRNITVSIFLYLKKGFAISPLPPELPNL